MDTDKPTPNEQSVDQDDSSYDLTHVENFDFILKLAHQE